jgi:hypothetical protein
MGMIIQYDDNDKCFPLNVKLTEGIAEINKLLCYLVSNVETLQSRITELEDRIDKHMDYHEEQREQGGS